MTRTLLLILAGLVAGHVDAQTALPDTLTKVRQTGSLTLGYRESSPPFSYIDDQQRPVGFSLDLCDQIVSGVRRHLGLRELKVAYQPVTAANRIPLLQNGTIDLECGSTTNTIARQKVVSFLLTTFVTGTSVMVKSSNGASGLRDLKGETVALTSGTNNINAIQAANQRDSLGLKIIYGKDHAESLLLLETGRAAAFSTDEILLYSLRANAANPKQFKVVGELLSEEPYGIMVRKDDPSFKALGDDILRGLFKDGSYGRIYAKWFTSPIPPKGVNLELPMSPEVRAIVANPSDRGS
ncbi:MAG: amino acid ABC transporter substrate-binding protein [Burkholderiales bacterium]|nr:amino acid ABC transporter substrate-binding protein [Burkholderiales bacterium]MCE7876396.1 amino acid ABC transporter substrate-binding protein [Betaproteobacteria bacterium PRO3]